MALNYLLKRNFSFYVKHRANQSFTYEKYARNIQDTDLDFPHGKRNKIILVGRELDHLIELKLKEQQSQADLEKQIKELEEKKDDKDIKQLEILKSQREIVSGNGCILLYRSMLQMTQKLALFEMGDLVLEDIPKNHNFLVLHRLLNIHAKWEEVDKTILAFLAQFPHNPAVMYELDTIKFSEFDTQTNVTDIYWCQIIDKLQVYFDRKKFR
ncbi:UNKNOWN [Stylonychia lemnae]|uniref:Uncharacterized protein n=1 Tax=Stylonychia lemnae TaxID=5949 RepID=A0A078A465_STYLE|nr:UNKNOWN [Stylonychia lemnae]|eukprot:CDW76679.1 UNKNOWN [Stylonychia lemnae]